MKEPSWPVLDTDGEKKLAAAVVKLALEDASRGDRAALEWLRGESDSLTFWLSLLDIDPQLVREVASSGAPLRFRSLVSNGNVSSPSLHRTTLPVIEQQLTKSQSESAKT